MRQFAAGARHFEQAALASPQLAWHEIWHYLASARAGNGSAALEQLGARRTAMKAGSMAALISDFYLGRIQADGVLELVKEGAKNAGMHCTANFHLGQALLMQGDREKARVQFNTIREQCSPTSIERRAALPDLARLAPG